MICDVKYRKVVRSVSECVWCMMKFFDLVVVVGMLIWGFDVFWLEDSRVWLLG